MAVDANHDLIVALGTIAVAIFTATLWWSTHQLWRAGENQIRVGLIAAKAAKKSADTARQAFTNLERPYVFIFDVMMPHREFLDAIKFPSVQIPRFMVYDVANFGKTPATIDNIEIGLTTLIDQNGKVPILRADHDHRLIVSDSMSPGKQQSKIVQEFGDNIWVEAVSGRFMPRAEEGADIYFRAVVSYHGPFTGRHETGGFWRYDFAAEAFVRVADERYNYNR